MFGTPNLTPSDGGGGVLEEFSELPTPHTAALPLSSVSILTGKNSSPPSFPSHVGPHCILAGILWNLWSEMEWFS